MSELIRFMMMIIALVLLSSLSSGKSQEADGETKRSVAISLEKKVPEHRTSSRASDERTPLIRKMQRVYPQPYL